MAVPTADVSVTDYVLRHAARLGDKPALIDGPTGRTLSYRQLADGINRMAAGLARRGFRKGDVFAIYSPNLPEYAIAFFGVARAGGINTTINPLHTADELANQLNDSGARFLLTVPPFLDKAREAAAKSLALYQLRGDVMFALGLSYFIDRDYVRMVERRGGTGLLFEAEQAGVAFGNGGRQELERRFAAEVTVFSQVHFSHPAAPHLTDYTVVTHPRAYARLG